MRSGRSNRRRCPRGGHGRRRAGRFLLDDQPPHDRARRRPLARRPPAAHGRHRRRQRGQRPRDLPQAAGRPPRRPRGLRHRRHPHRARVPGARSAALRLHGQRHLVGAARGGHRGPHRPRDARRAGARRPHRVRGRSGGGAHRWRALLLGADSNRLGGRAAGRQRNRGARHRVVLLRDLARRRPRAGSARARGTQAPHEGHQPGQPRRRHRARRRVRRAHERRDVRPGHATACPSCSPAASATTARCAIR